jgi:plastocyanin
MERASQERGGIGMRRAVLLIVIAGAATLTTGPAALAGGGCHGAATQQDDRGEEAATVEMVDACFSASITTVDPGTEVTFVNLDEGVTHNVGGNLWGNLEDMYAGDTYTAIFDEAGIYPFACSYHPGMTGAIVVGDGKGAGNGTEVSTAPPELDPVSTTTTSEPVAATSASPAPWIVAAGVGGLGLGAAAMFAIAGRKRD